jgi:hypothetical protein
MKYLSLGYFMLFLVLFGCAEKKKKRSIQIEEEIEDNITNTNSDIIIQDSHIPDSNPEEVGNNNNYDLIIEEENNTEEIIENESELSLKSLNLALSEADFSQNGDKESRAFIALSQIVKMPAGQERESLSQELAKNSKVMSAIVSEPIDRKNLAIAELIINDLPNSEAKKNFINQKLDSDNNTALKKLVLVKNSVPIIVDKLIALLAINGAEQSDIISQNNDENDFKHMCFILDGLLSQGEFVNFWSDPKKLEADNISYLVLYSLSTSKRAHAFKSLIESEKLPQIFKEVIVAHLLSTVFHKDLSSEVQKREPFRQGNFISRLFKNQFYKLNNLNKVLSEHYGITNMLKNKSMKLISNNGTLVYLLISELLFAKLALNKTKAVIYSIGQKLKPFIQDQWTDIILSKTNLDPSPDINTASPQENCLDIIINKLKISEKEAKKLLQI